jgi:DNA adenine methylase
LWQSRLVKERNKNVTGPFYLDPPYHGNENDYGRGLFERADFERLAKVLRGLSGRFILSINDVPQIREIFAGFDIEAVETRYSIAKNTTRRGGARELIISNGGGV